MRTRFDSCYTLESGIPIHAALPLSLTGRSKRKEWKQSQLDTQSCHVHLDYQGVWNISAEVLLSREEVESLRMVQSGCLGKALPDLVGWNQNMEPVKSDVHTELVKQASSVALMMYVQAAGCGVYCSCKSRQTCMCSDALLPDTLLTVQLWSLWRRVLVPCCIMTVS